MKTSIVFMILALLLVACLLSAGCLSFLGTGSKTSGSSAQATKTPAPTPTPTPTKVPPTTVKPVIPTKVPCKNCASG